MVSIHFSVRQLLAAVALAGVGLAAYAGPSPTRAAILFSTCLLTLGVAAVAACFGHGTSRVFAGGFAVLGAWYLAAFLATSLSSDWRGALATSQFIDWLFEFRASGDALAHLGQEWNLSSPPPLTANGLQLRSGVFADPRNLPTWRSVSLSLHSLFVIASGWLGGVSALLVAGPSAPPPRSARSAD